MGSGHFSGFQGLFLRISSWRPGIRRLSRGIRRFSRRWDQRLFFPHPLLPLACYSRAQHFWRRGFMPARPRKLLLSREEASKAERQEVHSLCRPPAPAEHIVLRAKLDRSTPRLLWPPSRRAPVVPIRVCQHDDANRRNGQETEIGDRAGEG